METYSRVLPGLQAEAAETLENRLLNRDTPFPAQATATRPTMA